MAKKKMDKLRLSEILRRVKKDGITLTRRTFQFYQKIGLLPKPEAKEKGKKGGVYGLYDPLVIDLIKLIEKYKAKGMTLYEITEKLRCQMATKKVDDIPVSAPSNCSTARQHLVQRLVHLYRLNPLRVATICDESLDRAGALLGYLRDVAHDKEE